ncbi:MAG: hypothetical protein H6662_19140 [Ardenticatenaceae bacterium]|nr:hypothetical protein [Anaerolineales bacterium]MCB8923708.1 hypothetical protein [Ardenticatenaceae bacterium]
MKTQLELMCNTIDQVLAVHGLAAKVAGGYVAGNGVLFSLTDTTFVDTQVRLDLKEALRVGKVFATVGVVLVNGIRRPDFGADIIEGELVEGVVPVIPADEVETVDLLTLMDAHEAELGNGRILPPQTKTAVEMECIPSTAVVYSFDSEASRTSYLIRR